MMTLTKPTGDMENRTSLFETVDEAADEIIETLDLEERVRISNLPNSDVRCGGTSRPWPASKS